MHSCPQASLPVEPHQTQALHNDGIFPVLVPHVVLLPDQEYFYDHTPDITEQANAYYISMAAVRTDFTPGPDPRVKPEPIHVQRVTCNKPILIGTTELTSS